MTRSTQTQLNYVILYILYSMTQIAAQGWRTFVKLEQKNIQKKVPRSIISYKLYHIIYMSNICAKINFY